MGSHSLLQERPGKELGKDRFLFVFGYIDHGGKSWPDLRLWAQHVFSAHLARHGGRREGALGPGPSLGRGGSSLPSHAGSKHSCLVPMTSVGQEL